MESNNTASIEPWLNLDDGETALEHISAFNALETYHRNPNGGLVVRLEVNGAGFGLQ